MSFGGVMLAMSAVSAISQIGQGYVSKAEANYNATVAQEQAKSIEVQKQIEAGQYKRQAGKLVSTSLANISKAGIRPTGSAMAVMVDAQTQIGIDQAIGQYNLEQQKQFKTAQASQYKRQGKYAVYGGYSNAFSSLLKGVSNYAMYSGGLDLSQGAKRAGKG